MLTTLEANYLSRIARGYTVHDIATQDSVPVSTIADALNSASATLGASNLMEAVTKAVRLGLVSAFDPPKPKADDG